MQVGSWGNFEDDLSHSRAVAVAVRPPVMRIASLSGGNKALRLFDIDSLGLFVVFLKTPWQLETRVQHGHLDTGCLLSRFLETLAPVLAVKEQIMYAIQVLEPFIASLQSAKNLLLAVREI